MKLKMKSIKVEHFVTIRAHSRFLKPVNFRGTERERIVRNLREN